MGSYRSPVFGSKCFALIFANSIYACASAFGQAGPPASPPNSLPSRDTHLSRDAIARCDTYAASEFDPRRTSGAVPFEKLDPKLAIPACEEAVKQFPEDARLHFELGRAYQKANNFSDALLHYKKAGEQGLAVAENNLAVMYQNGWGVQQNFGIALTWFRKAADQNLALAEHSLGLMYQNGWGVQQDFGTASTWYRKAADQNLAASQYALGSLNLNGSGVKVDYDAALSWYRKAADQNLAPAQNDLGVMYQNGWGVQQNFGTALVWFRKAADQNFANAEFSLGQMYWNGWGVKKDFATALTWYRKAAVQNFAPAQYMLGEMYDNGWGVAKDPSIAFEWVRKAADQNFPAAQNDLAVMYARGSGVPENLQLAAAYYRKAAKQGVTLARMNLGRLYLSGVREPGDLDIIFGQFKKQIEGVGAQPKVGGKLTIEGRSVEQKVQVAIKIVSAASNAAYLESCGLRLDVERRAVEAVKDCVETDSLNRLITFFRNEKASLKGASGTCTAPETSKVVGELDEEIQTWGRMCRACGIICGR
ncbi:TPR repeat protein [Bradyrhizobium sp. JR1.5]|uniref:hypothetical protein n=1 Tax=unclassified Bradyrhizobium TaxID=2631580 RepID=UPI003398EBF7